jgi:hypothetical protein
MIAFLLNCNGTLGQFGSFNSIHKDEFVRQLCANPPFWTSYILMLSPLQLLKIRSKFSPKGRAEAPFGT